MITIRNCASILACLIYLQPGIATAEQGLELSSSTMRVSVNQTSGDIDTLEIAADPALQQHQVTILQHGKLLSLSAIATGSLRSQTRHREADGSQVIRSEFALDSSLLVTREIRMGDAAYTLIADFRVENLTDTPIALSPLELRFGSGFEGMFDPLGGYGSSIYAYRDLFLSQGGGAERVAMEDMQALPIDTATDWVGWINRYHVLALHPLKLNADNPTRSDPVLATLEASTEPPAPETTLFSFSLPAALPAGESHRFAFEILAAPKNSTVLSRVQPALDGVVLINLWNWFRWLCFAVNQLIFFLFSLTGNWGITLILLALVVRLLTIPITRSSLKNQERAIAQQQKMAPMVKAVKEKYTGVELSQQMIDLYEREKFDQLLPFKGMLGLFVQIPIFIALFNVLGEAPEISGASFLWVQDLALSDRMFYLGADLPFFGGYFNLLPFVMAAVTVLSTWYASKNNQGQQMQYGALFTMAGVFFVLFYSFPAALVLYWTLSNVFQLVQQIIEDYAAGHKAQSNA